jgi:hypothetical protein
MTDSSQSHRIFISYAREDAYDMALSLRNDLTDAGHSVWLDMAEIAAGASWSRNIEEAIENCDLAITLLSTGSYVSDICRAEQLRALRKGKAIVPVLVQAHADRPIHLENLNYLDFSDLARYAELLPDLLTYISTGQMPHNPTLASEDSRPMPVILPPKEKTGAMSPMLVEKRDSRAFRRYLTDLRDEPWLKDHHWWTYFLFYYADIQTIAEILQSGAIKPVKRPSPYKRKRSSQNLDSTVRLYFRPRTPELFMCEGVRPQNSRPDNHCALPVYLVFDLEAILTLPNTRFSEGDVAKTNKTFKAATAFRDMPFDLIYHDAAFFKDERDEIISARRAQVFIPNALDLTHLKHIWCRSAAEYETLYTSLPEEVRRQWGDKITVRSDYELFNRTWTYVDDTMLFAEGALFRFNSSKNDHTFTVRAEIEVLPGEIDIIDLGELALENDLSLDLSALPTSDGYNIRLFLDDALAYSGRFEKPRA